VTKCQDDSERAGPRVERDTLGVNDDARERIERYISATAVSGRPWKRRLFEFARRIKPTADAYGIGASNIVILKETVRVWYDTAKPDATFTDVWGEFSRALPRVKYPSGTGALHDIIERADSMPPPGRYDEPKTDRLLAICAALQEAAGDKPFFLSCRIAGEAVGLDHSTAADRLRLFVVDGWLTVAEKHTKTRATRYRLRQNPYEWG
jgi:hypothetical protein